MYKQMAAFAAALIAKPDRYIPVFAFSDGAPTWAITDTGRQCYSNLATAAHKLSILGAMRAASESLGGSRAYNTLDREVRRIAFETYGATKLCDLDHELSVKILLAVA